jgi:hypothetical protein
VFRNDCGQTITVKTAAQATGVTLLNGEATLVFCDGTNAMAGIATAGVGPTTVANGGTGVTSFTAGFVKSPGGTGALTSSSSVSLTADVSGTLPVANGGTGVTSVTSGRIVLGNGSGPLTVLSGNNNGDLATWSSATSSWVALPATGAGVTSFNTRTGAVTLNSTDVTNALTYTPYNGSTNPNNYVTASGSNTFTGNNSYTGTNSYTSGSIDYSSSSDFLVRGSGRLWVRTVNDPVSPGSSGIISQAYNFTSTGYSMFYASSAISVSVNSVTVGKFDQSGGANRFLLHNSTQAGIQYDNSNQVGIGFSGSTFWIINNSPQYIDSSTADVRKPGGGPFNASVSDSRLKDNVVNYTQGLNAIKQLRPVNYNLNDVTKLGAETNYKTFTGLIAQEVQKTDLSNMVIPGMEGYLTLDTSELTYALINAVKELSAQVDTLKTEVAALKGV